MELCYPGTNNGREGGSRKGRAKERAECILLGDLAGESKRETRSLADFQVKEWGLFADGYHTLRKRLLGAKPGLVWCKCLVSTLSKWGIGGVGKAGRSDRCTQGRYISVI